MEVIGRREISFLGTPTFTPHKKISVYKPSNFCHFCRMGLYSRDIIKQIIAECGHARCHYCDAKTRVQYSGCPKQPDHATLDHKIPKSKGGSNARENLVLSCYACNSAKGDRSYEDFCARPYPLKSLSRGAPLSALERAKRKAALVKPVSKKKPVVHPAYKARKGTLTAAINSGEVTEFGMYKGTPRRELVVENRERIKPVPYHETMWILTGKRAPKRSEIFDERD